MKKDTTTTAPATTTDTTTDTTTTDTDTTTTEATTMTDTTTTTDTATPDEFTAKLAGLMQYMGELNAAHIARATARRDAVTDFLAQIQVAALPIDPKVKGHTPETVAEYARARQGTYAVMPTRTENGYTVSVVLVHAPSQKLVDDQWMDVPTADIQAKFTILGLFTDLTNEVHLTDARTAEAFQKTADRLERAGRAAPTGAGAAEVMALMANIQESFKAAPRGRNR